MESLNLFSGLDEEWGEAAVKPCAYAIEEMVRQAPGLAYVSEFITKDEERALLNSVNAEPWSTQWQRRIQYYGARYAEGPLHGDAAYTPGALPAWSEPFAQRLFERGIFDRMPNQVGVNEYLPGQGIAPHVDYSGGAVVSLSLNSGCVMDLTQIEGDGHISLWLEPRSIIVLKNDVRYRWKHGIARRQKDVWQGRTIFRTRRVSVTFRDIAARPEP